MPRINLLPWREQERKVRRREFLVAAGAAVFAAVIFALGGKVVYSSWIDAQNEKNNLLKKEIVKLDAQIADIQDLENRKQRLVARMEIIEKLQSSRPKVVHLFDELVKQVPDGIYLTRNIDGSAWLANPVLQVVEATKDSPTGSGSSFTLITDTIGVDLDNNGPTTVKKVAAK